MAKVRVQRLEQPHLVTFDEQVWPINVALLVMAGFVTGCIVALSDFGDPRPLYNGWVRTGTLLASVGVLMWAANFIASQRLRRSLQLAVVLSCLFHFMLMAVLYNMRLPLVAQNLPETESPLNEPDSALPDYHIQTDDAPQQDFEKPIEVDTPQEEQPPTEVTREEAKLQETPSDSQPTPVPGSTPEVQPSSVKLPEMEQAAPRKSEQASLLSRQSLKLDAQPQQPVDAPEAAANPAETAATLEAKSTAMERQASELTQQRAPETEQPQVAPEQQTGQLTRSEAEQLTQLPSSVATLSRQVNQPAAGPRAEADNPQATPAASESPSAVQPNVIVSRREVDGPQAVMQQSAEPQAASGAEVAKLDAARNDPNDRPQVASTPEKSVDRSAEPTLITNTAAVEAPQAPQAAGESPANPAPTTAALERSQSSAPANVANPGAVSEATAASQPAAVVGPQVERAEVAPAATLNPQAAPSAQLARASTAAGVEASPVQVDSPAAAEAPAGSQPQAAPAPTALAKGSTGQFGGGQEQNFDRGLTATQQPAPVASMAAERPSNLQAGAEGPALAPSAPAAVSKSVAGADRPSATVASADLPTGDTVAAAQVGALEASSSAALRKAEGKGQPAKVSAAAGSGEIDLGPTQVVANVGSGRAAGGGAPAIHVNTQTAQVARSNTGGAPVSALAAPAVAAVPQAPAGDGGGAPAPSPNVGPQTTVARTAGGGDLPSGTPGPAAPQAGSGPTAVAGGAVARATGGEALPGPSLPGGSKLPSRNLGRALAADVKADAPQLPSGPAATSESPGASPGQPGGAPAARSVAGLPGAATGAPVGAATGPTPIDSALAGSPGLGASRVAAAPAGDPAVPAVGSLATGGPLRKSNVAGLPGGSAATIDAPVAEGTAGGAAPSQPSAVAAAGEVGSPGRRVGSLPVQVAAVEGPGGLGSELSPNVGSLSRRAQRDSDVIHTGKERFLARKEGGPLAVDGKAREPARAFAGRGGQRSVKAGGSGTPLERTEESIELGLDFLARHQSADGSWSLNNFGAGRPGYEKEKAAFVSDTAATGLALLAYFGAGYDHYDDQYQNVVRGGLESLIRNQKPNGDLYQPLDPESNKSAQFYSHGIATIALCEAYGMTGDEKLRDAAQKAIEFIIASQHPQRGGWRYAAQFDSDTSVSGWQLMALKSGELAGLKIPKETYDRVRRWLDSAQAADGEYSYNPNAPNTVAQRHGRRPTTTMTAVGLLMRLYTGWDRNDPRMAAGAKHLLDHLPSVGTTAQPERDTYYWYYATQVMFHMKGDYWKQWNERLHPLLVERQVATGPMAGSWDPLGPIADRWGAQGGRIYVTTLNLLSLEVNYRHLPIYESEGK